jgi:hypothetical protein
MGAQMNSLMTLPLNPLTNSAMNNGQTNNTQVQPNSVLGLHQISSGAMNAKRTNNMSRTNNLSRKNKTRANPHRAANPNRAKGRKLRKNSNKSNPRSERSFVSRSRSSRVGSNPFTADDEVLLGTTGKLRVLSRLSTISMLLASYLLMFTTWRSMAMYFCIR